MTCIDISFADCLVVHRRARMQTESGGKKMNNQVAGTNTGVVLMCAVTANGQPLTLEDVEAYVKYKAFDVIGNGSYRKYVNSVKERGESWATDVLQHVSAVSAAVKYIQTLVGDLQNAYNRRGLYQLCQAVIENNTPPIDQATVIAECIVSGKDKCHCIVLRCKGRGASSITVQGRFSHFILMLWTVFKMDLVIKTTTRDFIDSLDNSDDMSMKQLCDMYSAQDDRLPHSIFHAVQHVTNSLHEALTNS